ncbi:MAG TPA: hypothetical protein VGM25_15920 [Caulobacteraceae bacterium]
MARFSPADSVFAGFRFARERPATLLVWAAYLLAATAVTSVAMLGIGGDSLAALNIAARGASPDPQQLMKLMDDVLPATMFGALLMLVFGAVLSTAILRVRMTPGPHTWGGLKLGGGELRLLGSKVLVFAATVLALGPIAVVAALLQLAGVPAPVGLALGMLLLLAPLMIRLSLAGVVSQAEGRLSPVRSFLLTKPLFWRLLGAFVLLGAIMLVILVLVAIVFTALIGATTLGGGSNMDQIAMAAMQGRFDSLNPLVAGLTILSNLAQVWVLVVFQAVFLSVAVDAYDSALREQG